MASKDETTYEEARNTCKSLNGSYDLVSIGSAGEHKFIGYIFNSLDLGYARTGLKGSKRNMSWSDGLTFGFGSDYLFPWPGNSYYRPKDDVSVKVDTSS